MRQLAALFFSSPNAIPFKQTKSAWSRPILDFRNAKYMFQHVNTMRSRITSVATFAAREPRVFLSSVPTTPILRQHIPRRAPHLQSRSLSALPSHISRGPLTPGSVLHGDSGRAYTIQKVLAERHQQPPICVYQASSEEKVFMIKNLIPGEYTYQQELQRPFAACLNLRTMVDGISEAEMLVYEFLETDFLQVTRKDLDLTTKKSIIRSALTGLAALHERNIIHTDIKPNNILLDYEEADGTLSVKRVQISDFEDAVMLPPGKYLREGLCGNPIWRSPESWARAAQGTPSDIFSFGIVSIYVLLNDMVLRASDEELAADDSWKYVLQRQISFFAEEEGFQGLLKWIGEKNPFFQRLVDLAGRFDIANPRKPFGNWHFVDPQFRDIVRRMTCLDPAKRITAADALRHPWFM